MREVSGAAVGDLRKGARADGPVGKAKRKWKDTKKKRKKKKKNLS